MSKATGRRQEARGLRGAPGTEGLVRAALAAVLLFGGGCAQTYDPLPERRLDPDDQEESVTREGLAAEWTHNGEWLVSPLLAAPDGATRVGVLIEMGAAGELPRLEARLISGANPATGWAPLAATWSEAGYHVAVVDFPAAGDAAQLRVAIGVVDAVRHLSWSAVIPALEDEGASDEPYGTEREALRAELRGLGIVTREEWGARATRCSSTDGKTKMAIHYTVTPSDNPAAQVRAIQRYHMDTKGWCDIGYHFLVGADGSLYEGRPLQLVGAHVGGHNTGNIGVSFIGCFHPSGCSGMGPTTPPAAMLEAGGRLLGALSRLYGIPLNREAVKGHREYPGTSTNCPGDYLYARIDDLLAIGRGSSGAPAPAPSEPAPSGDGSCRHSYGGVYAHTACSAAYQCCDGSWSARGSCGACLCVEETGRTGCTAAPPPAPAPPPPASCGGLACGVCEATAGCDWCAATGGCGPADAACTWRGAVGGEACWSELWPCAEARCWNPSATLPACGTWTQNEDFSSGAYSVHRYWVRLPAGGRLTLRLERTGGTFAPALLVTDRGGRPIYGGAVAALHPDVAVLEALDGRSGSAAQVVLSSARDLDAYLYVTGWAILDGAFRGSLSTSSRYRLTAAHDCSGGAPPPPSTSTVWAGLSQDGSEVPRAGLTNPTLRATLGISTEPYGEVTSWSGGEWVRGRVSWFGGPADTGVSATETGAVTGERLRALNSPLDPDAATLRSRPADYYFVAMRWSYSPNGTSWWRNARLVVANPRTGAQVVVRPVDWGPNTSTRRVIDVSPQTMRDLGVTTDDEVLVAFALPGTPLGPVSGAP